MATNKKPKAVAPPEQEEDNIPQVSEVEEIVKAVMEAGRDSMTEAGCIVWLDAYDQQGVKHSVTLRDPYYTNVLRVLTYVSDVKRELIASGWTIGTAYKRPNNPQGWADDEDGAELQTELSGAPPPPPADTGVDNLGDVDNRGKRPGEKESIDAALVKITPQAGGKVKLAFTPRLQDGNPGQYAEVFATSEKEKVEAAFEKVGSVLYDGSTPYDFTYEAELELAGVQVNYTYSTKGNKSKNGNYYRDFTGIQKS